MPIVEFVPPVLAAGPADLLVKSLRTGAPLASCPTSWGTTDGNGSVTKQDVPLAVQEVVVTDRAAIANTFHLDYTVLRSREVSVFGGNNVGSGLFTLSIRTKRPPTADELLFPLPGNQPQSQPLADVFVTADSDNLSFSGMSDGNGDVGFSWTPSAGYFVFPNSPSDEACVIRAAKAGYVPAVIGGATFALPGLIFTPPTYTLELQPLPAVLSGPVLLNLSLARNPDAVEPAGFGGPWKAASATVGDDASVGFSSRGVGSVSLPEGEYEIHFSSPFYEVDTALTALPIMVELELPGPVEVGINVKVTFFATPVGGRGDWRYKFLPVGRAPDTSRPPVYKYKVLTSTAWLSNDADGVDVSQTVSTAGGAELFTYDELQQQAGAEMAVVTEGTYYFSLTATGYEAICGQELVAAAIGGNFDFDGGANNNNTINLNIVLLTATTERDDLTSTLNITGTFQGQTVGPGTSIEVFSDSACTTKIAGPVSPTADGIVTVQVTDPCWVKGYDSGGDWGPKRVDF